MTKASNKEFRLKMYNLKDENKMCFSENFGDKEDSFTKAKDVELWRERPSTTFAVAYLDNGIFKLRLFGLE